MKKVDGVGFSQVRTFRLFPPALIVILLMGGLLGMVRYAEAAEPENLALYRPVSVSSTGHYAVMAEFAVDGEVDTAWRSDRPLPSDDSGDHLTVDLQADCRVESIRLTWESRGDQPVFEEMRTTDLFGGEQVAAYGLAYSVLLSPDGKDWQTAYSTTRGAGGMETIHLEPTQARFVQVVIHQRSHPKCGVGISELAVMGACDADRPAGDSWKLRRKAKVQPVPATGRAVDRELLLDSGWEMTCEDWANLNAPEITRSDVDTSAWYNATVPGTVLTTLVEQEVFPEPTIGMNNLRIPDSLCRRVWWYRTELAVPADWMKTNQRLWLEFDGINYQAEVWLNARRVGTIRGAFRRGKFDITEALNNTGKNILAVRILPPVHPGMPLEKREDFWLYNGGALGKDSPAYLASIGWDWMGPVRDRGMGLWDAVRLRRTGEVVIGDPQIVTDLPLPDTSRADVSIAVPVRNVSDQPQRVVVKAAFEEAAVSQTVSLRPKESRTVKFTPETDAALALKDPKLWWPAGYGDPHLYHLTLSAEANGQTSDTQAMRFGVRELSFRGSKLVPRPSNAPDQPDELEISVNGQRIFCRGGNWGCPEMLLRLSRERLETAARLHREANFTMIRNWVGMNTTKAFYDLCDEYGLLIWNDFWLANPVDGPNPDDPQLFLDNVRDAVLRYRNHPSIALWCGRNEGMPPVVLDEGMRRLTTELDGTRYYQSHSSDVGVNGNGPYRYMPPEQYFDKLTRGFKTEIGMPSVPGAESLRRMLDDPNPWPIDARWAYHDFCPEGNQYRDEYIKALEEKFGPAADLDDFCRKAQMINYDGYRAIFEGCNHKLWNDCSGLLLWMSHPAWPSMVWQVYDYWYGTDGAYFGSKKANEPTHIQLCPLNDTVEMINHTAEPVAGTVSATVFGPDASILWQKSEAALAAANRRTESFAIQWPDDLPPACLVKLEWTDGDGRMLSENTYWHGRENSSLRALETMPEVELSGIVLFEKNSDGEPTAAVRLTNGSDHIALMAQLVLRDAQTNERILPAYYSDNFLSLLPGEFRTVNVTCTQKDAGRKMKISVTGWNIKPGDIR